MSLCRLCLERRVDPVKELKGAYQSQSTLCSICRSKIWSEKAIETKKKVKRYQSTDGYIHIRHPETGKFIPEHRYIMSIMLGRVLREGEAVHHIDGNRVNNNRDNLELWIRPSPYGIRASELTCPHCGKVYKED